jgi:rfaE bifunctional protein nucleotidyltransferase chain/domain
MERLKEIESISRKWIDMNQIESIKISLADKKIVFTNGCFDILHRGHVDYLSRAKDLGDVLWVGLNSDESVRRIKGSTRPIHSSQDRQFVLSGLQSVDFVTIFQEDTPIELLKKIQPSVHTKGGDYDIESLPETPFIRSWGGVIEILPFIDGKSTTGILKKLEESSGS